MIGFESLSDCFLCPRQCHVNRNKGVLGYCRTDASFVISSICIHRGEEPVISGDRGICNIFFNHCNMQCIYCQNHQISDNYTPVDHCKMELPHILDRIEEILSAGINLVGFVSPSHMIPHMLAIIKGINNRGLDPRWVFNSNGYDSVETLRELEGIIDIYIPDLKYLDSNIARRFSDTPDYPEIASLALREMYRQKGSVLHTGDSGLAESGILIRHLVLPGHVENSINVLRFIAGELSPSMNISLMSQYYPIQRMSGHEYLGRTLYLKEYEEVLGEMEHLGLGQGFIQEMNSREHYRPDFRNKHPFEDT